MNRATDVIRGAELKTSGRDLAGRGRASDRVLKVLRRMIITSELPPGTQVTEAALVELLHCSRTPLREALQRLAAEHLVVAVPRRGVTIAELGIVDFGSIVQALEAVEATLVRLAAQRISDDEITRIEQMLAESDVALANGDMEEIVDLDFQVHTTFGKASGNRFLLEFEEILLRLLGRYIYLGFMRAGNAKGAIADHREIVAALRAHDPDACEAALRAHLNHGRERMRSAL
jgi:DNA-binding GntR family transcriptional regulator